MPALASGRPKNSCQRYRQGGQSRRETSQSDLDEGEDDPGKLAPTDRFNQASGDNRMEVIAWNDSVSSSDIN